MPDNSQPSLLAEVVYRAIAVAVDMRADNVYRATWAIMDGAGTMLPAVAAALLAEGYPSAIVQAAARAGETAYAEAGRWLR